MSSLYTLNGRYIELMQRIMDADELTDELHSELSISEEDFDKEAINKAAIVRNLEIDADAITSAIEDMENRKHRLLKKISQIKTGLMQGMELRKVENVHSARFDIKIRLNNPKVHDYDKPSIPEKYWRETVTKSLNKVLILQDLKNSIAVPGAELVRERRLEIK